MPAALQRALGGERIEREDLRIVRGDGSRAVIRLSAAPLFDDGGAQVGAVLNFIDVTSDWKEQDALDLLAEGSGAGAQSLETGTTLRVQRIRAEESTARLEHLHALTSALTVAITTDDVLDALVAEMGDLVGASVIAVLLLDESRTRLRIARATGLPPAVEERFREIPVDGDFIAAKAARTNEAIWLQTYEDVVAESPLLRAVPTRVAEAWASVPLTGPGGVIGVVALAFSTPQPFPEPLRNFILSIVRQSGQALERARLFDSERRARKEAEQASQAKDEFLAVLSHELRTPMTTVIGWSDLLRLTYDGGDPSIVMAIESLRAGALTQARLIDDLLDVSRIITGKLQVDKRETNLSECVVSAAEALRITAETKGLTLRVDSDGPIWVEADPARLRQIVTNLVANAVKFTPRGGEVDVRVVARPDVAKIIVRDTGEGIAPDFLPHVFERFRQASIGDSRLHTGLGLGLSIVHHLVQLHGGSVRAESDGSGKGATFTVTLPTKGLADSE
jgi:signal transduction histidine kinase